MYYLDNIAEFLKVSSTIEHWSAWTYLWKWHIPLKVRINYRLHKRHWEAQTRILNTTTSALCSGQTDKTLNELEHIVIRKQSFDVFTPLVYFEQHKLDFHWEENFLVDIDSIGSHPSRLNYSQYRNNSLELHWFSSIRWKSSVLTAALNFDSTGFHWKDENHSN